MLKSRVLINLHIGGQTRHCFFQRFDEEKQTHSGARIYQMTATTTAANANSQWLDGVVSNHRPSGNTAAAPVIATICRNDAEQLRQLSETTEPIATQRGRCHGWLELVSPRHV